MIALYLFTLVLGGGFLLASLLGHGDGDGHFDVDVHLDVDLDVDADVGADLDVDHAGVASRILSFRTIVYALFGFGATGSLLTWLGAGGATSFGFAALGGLLSGALVGTMFRYLKATDSGAAPRDVDLIGRTGHVILPLSTNVPGNIVIERGGRRVTLRALPHASAPGEPDAWSAIVIVEMEKGVARVAPLDADELGALPAPEGDEPSP